MDLEFDSVPSMLATCSDMALLYIHLHQRSFHRCCQWSFGDQTNVMNPLLIWWVGLIPIKQTQWLMWPQRRSTPKLAGHPVCTLFQDAESFQYLSDPIFFVEI